MRKRTIALLFSFLLVISTLLLGCSSDTSELPEPLDASVYNDAPYSVGIYSLFQTTDPQEYLNFLDNFDESKYEIVDISTYYRRPNVFYVVTYKSIA